MAKTASSKKKPDRAKEIAEVDALITRLDEQMVPQLTLEASIEECRQLGDRFELVHVEALDVESPQHYSEYGSFLRRIKTIQKRLEEGRVEEKEPVLRQGREIDARWKAFAGFADRLFVLFEGAMDVWDAKQAELQRKEEARLREKARKEQERLDKAAAKKAAKLEAEGRHDEADAVVEAVPAVPTPTVANTNVPKVAGVSKPTKYYRAEMSEADVSVQEKRLAAAIAAWNVEHEDKQIIAAEYWELSEKKLDASARNLKTKFSQPNVKVVDKPKRSVRV